MRNKSLLGTLVALLLITGAAAAASAQEVSQAEKGRALQYLESTKKNVLEATKGLSEAQWNFKPAPDRWSVAQVMEHIAAAEDFLRETTKEKVMTGPAGHGNRTAPDPVPPTPWAVIHRALPVTSWPRFHPFLKSAGAGAFSGKGNCARACACAAAKISGRSCRNHRSFASGYMGCSGQPVRAYSAATSSCSLI